MQNATPERRCTQARTPVVEPVQEDIAALQRQLAEQRQAALHAERAHCCAQAVAARGEQVRALQEQLWEAQQQLGAVERLCVGHTEFTGEGPPPAVAEDAFQQGGWGAPGAGSCSSMALSCEGELAAGCMRVEPASGGSMEGAAGAASSKGCSSGVNLDACQFSIQAHYGVQDGVCAAGHVTEAEGMAQGDDLDFLPEVAKLLDLHRQLQGVD